MITQDHYVSNGVSKVRLGKTWQNAHLPIALGR